MPDLLWGDTCVGQEHEGVVEEVGGLLGEALVVALDGVDDGFAGFLDDLLGDPADAFLEEERRVAAGWGVLLAALDDLEYLSEDSGSRLGGLEGWGGAGDRVVEARSCARVAGGPFRPDPQ